MHNSNKRPLKVSSKMVNFKYIREFWLSFPYHIVKRCQAIHMQLNQIQNYRSTTNNYNINLKLL